MSRINYDLKKIRAVVFDVDGVLSPSTVPMSADGVPMRMANLKDGYSMQLAIRSGIRLCIITGADVPSIPGRFAPIGIK
ncbi:MAG: 3-deoxy-D-manno-octulosonate 8-phosphate phosphatase, partial [Muribaculaceae bacterium]|nr:3-deoxy-D-manno-octulosonate 8-phosphate phosphatase [Muribaculaceae bacterium]